MFAPVWSPGERRCVERDICGEVEESEKRMEGVVCVGRESDNWRKTVKQWFDKNGCTAVNS